jgi:hypothetical protein
VTLVRYPDQGHSLAGWALKDYWQRVDEFFGRLLKPSQGGA